MKKQQTAGSETAKLQSAELQKNELLHVLGGFSDCEFRAIDFGGDLDFEEDLRNPKCKDGCRKACKESCKSTQK